MRLCCQLAGHHTSCWPVLQCVTVCYSVLQCVRFGCGQLCPRLSLSSSFSSLLDSLGFVCPPPFYLFVPVMSSSVLFFSCPFWSFFVLLCPFPSSSLVPVMSSSISLCSDVLSSVCPLLSSPSSHCFPPCLPSCSLQFCYFLLCPHFFCSVSATILSSCPLLLPFVPSSPFTLSPSVLSSSLLSLRLSFSLLLPPPVLSSSDLSLLS